MKIIGAGKLGKTLGIALEAKSHDIAYGTRDPGKAKTAVQALASVEPVILVTPPLDPEGHPARARGAAALRGHHHLFAAEAFRTRGGRQTWRGRLGRNSAIWLSSSATPWVRTSPCTANPGKCDNALALGADDFLGAIAS